MDGKPETKPNEEEKKPNESWAPEYPEPKGELIVKSSTRSFRRRRRIPTVLAEIDEPSSWS